MKNAKYNFLKRYVDNTKTSEDKDIERALDFMSTFYEELPERSRGPERRKAWTMLVGELMNAFDKQIEKIASCPFVKIEIADQVDTKDILMALKTYADIERFKDVKVERESYGRQKNIK